MFKRFAGAVSLSFSCAVFLAVSGISTVSAGVINLANCNTAHVTIDGVGAASSCIGLLAKDGGGQPQPNDSEGLLNNQLLSTVPSEIWSAAGAFGINTWTFLGKDEQSVFTNIDVTSGNPATWTINPPLVIGGNYLFAAKQANELGLFFFPNLAIAATSGTVNFNLMFGDGTTDDGWSHFSIYGDFTDCEPNCSNPFPVPEPGLLSLLGLGLLGLGLSRRRLAA